MKKFCVAYVCFFENTVEQKIVECNDMLDAPIEAGFADKDCRSMWSTEEEMKGRFTDWEASISVIEIGE